MSLLEPRTKGLYCPAADLYIDPVRNVDRAVITHGHADHVHSGLHSVLTSEPGSPIVAHRLRRGSQLQSLPYGEKLRIGDAVLSLHPAGHILGSAQVRIEVNGKVAVVTGDYKRGADPTCEAFEPVPCELLVTETTFGRPEYVWPPPERLRNQLRTWWAENQDHGQLSTLLVYSLGKAQRVLAMLDPEQGPILVHGSIIPFLSMYRNAGIGLPHTYTLNNTHLQEYGKRAIVLVPPGAYRGSVKQKLTPGQSALVSGWTLHGDQRQEISTDTGIALSDHVDWPELLQTVEECQPEELWAMHGFREEVSEYFSAQGYKTCVV